MSSIRPARGTVRLATLLVCCAFAALPGCGDATKASLSGKVTYKGQPVTGGNLTLTPAAQAAPVSIFIKPDGSFSQSSVPRDNTRCRSKRIRRPVHCYNTGGKVPPGGAVQQPPDMTAGALKKVAIPVKYNDPKTANLPWEIKAGSNEKTFDLTD